MERPYLPGLAYPWRCLCFAFSQITRTTPLRVITLHFTQIFFTDARTFIALYYPYLHQKTGAESVLSYQLSALGLQPIRSELKLSTRHEQLITDN
jgi:hypothetical protein